MYSLFVCFNGRLPLRKEEILSLGFSSHPETKQTSLPPEGEIAQLPNSLGELIPYTATSFWILPGTQQIGNWSALYWTKFAQQGSSPLYDAKLTLGLVQTLAAD